MMLNREQVVGRLQAATRKQSIGASAKKIGVSRSYLVKVLRGEREPGPAILDYMNLQKHELTMYVTKATK